MKVNQITNTGKTYKNGNTVRVGAVDNTYFSNVTVSISAKIVSSAAGVKIAEVDPQLEEMTHVTIPKGQFGAIYNDMSEKIVGEKILSSFTYESANVDDATILLQSVGNVYDTVEQKLHYTVDEKEISFKELIPLKNNNSNTDIRNQIEKLKKQNNVSKGDKLSDSLMSQIKELYKGLQTYTGVDLLVQMRIKHTVNVNGQYVQTTLSDEKIANLSERAKLNYKNRKGRYVGSSNLQRVFPIAKASELKSTLDILRRTIVADPETDLKTKSYIVNSVEGINNDIDWQALKELDRNTAS